MTRILFTVAVLLASASCLYGDPTDEALRVQRYHDRLQQIGTGPKTSVWVLLRDGETLKGTIYYLSATELGIRDEFGHRRPVLLKGIVEFTARNQETGVKAASANRWYRAARQWWRRVNGTSYYALCQSSVTQSKRAPGLARVHALFVAEHPPVPKT